MLKSAWIQTQICKFIMKFLTWIIYLLFILHIRLQASFCFIFCVLLNVNNSLLPVYT